MAMGHVGHGHGGHGHGGHGYVGHGHVGHGGLYINRYLCPPPLGSVLQAQRALQAGNLRGGTAPAQPLRQFYNHCVLQLILNVEKVVPMASL